MNMAPWPTTCLSIAWPTIISFWSSMPAIRIRTSNGILPCGLGARNTLRLEAGMALYGHEIDASHTPLEACLDRYIKLDKGDFVGRDALAQQKAAGIQRKLVGLEMTGRGIGRDGY